MSEPAERMFFLVGRGRSGTTLLRRILDAHPALSIPPEGLFILYLRGQFPDAALTQKDSGRFAQLLFLERRMRRWELEHADLAQRLAIMPDRTFTAHCAEVYEAHADARGKEPNRLLGDKNPHYALFTEELAERFPHARFIHLVRDYRDNVLSYQGVPFDLGSPGALAYRWKAYNRSILRAANRWPERFLRIRLEELVEFPRKSVEQICSFLGVSFIEAMLDPASRMGTAQAWHVNVGKPLSSEIGRHQQSMAKPLLELTDAICQPLGTELGYPPVTNKRLPLGILLGTALGWAYTTLERLLFSLPLSVRILTINAYRRWTGNVIE